MGSGCSISSRWRYWLWRDADHNPFSYNAAHDRRLLVPSAE